MATLSLMAFALSHGSFSARVSRELAQHWRPKPVIMSDNVHFLPHSKKNIATYARALVLLNDGHEAFVSIDMGKMNLYIHRNSELKVCLWDATEHRHDVAFSNLRKWYRDTFPDATQLTARLCADDKEIWDRHIGNT